MGKRGPKPRFRGCAHAGCNREHASNGFCSVHYYQHRKSARTWDIKPKARPGQGSVNGNGYVVVKIKGRKVRQHRLVMEQMIGRPLRPDETVHHKNGDRADNRPENLELRSGNHGKGAVVEDKVAHAVEILNLYAPHLLNSKEQSWV